MRILILASDIYTRGGIARHTWALASALGGLIGPENVHILALLGTGGSKERPKGFRIVETVAERLTPAAKLHFAAKALVQARQGYDLLICTQVALAPVAAAIRWLRRSRYWTVCYGIEVWRRLPTLKLLALKRADLVLPISRFTAGMLSQANGITEDKVLVLYSAISDGFAGLLLAPNGINDALLPGTKGPKLILSVGMLSKDCAYKGFDVVIRALPRVLQGVPNARYVIVGDGDNKETLKTLAAEIGVEGHVEFAGEVSDARLAEYYRACDVFVLPSRVRQVNGHWEGEGFGRVYVEAALAGKPVVGSRDGGAAEAVLDGKTGLLVDPSSIADVARALVTLLQDPELAARMGREGQRWARENFTASALQKQLRGMLGTFGSARPEKEIACAGSSE